jgi:hypothetical protein
LGGATAAAALTDDAANGSLVTVADGAHTYKTVQAHTKGGVCAMAGHTLAPLLATGTSSQVISVRVGLGFGVGEIATA